MTKNNIIELSYWENCNKCGQQIIEFNMKKKIYLIYIATCKLDSFNWNINGWPDSDLQRRINVIETIFGYKIVSKILDIEIQLRTNYFIFINLVYLVETYLTPVISYNGKHFYLLRDIWHLFPHRRWRKCHFCNERFKGITVPHRREGYLCSRSCWDQYVAEHNRWVQRKEVRKWIKQSQIQLQGVKEVLKGKRQRKNQEVCLLPQKVSKRVQISQI